MVVAVAVSLGVWAGVSSGGFPVSSTHPLMSIDSDTVPDISDADIEVFVRVFDLGDDERAVLQALYDSYREAVREGGERTIREIMPHVRRAELVGTQTPLEPAHAIVAEWRSEKAELERSFLDDLTLLLTAEQEARWPIVERELRRIRSLPEGVIKGESIDLVRLSHSVLPASIRSHDLVAGALDRYSRDLDPALRARDAFHEDNHAAYGKALDEGRLEEARELWEEMRERRVDVRDVNWRGIAALRTAIIAAAGEAGAEAVERDPRALADAFEREALDAVFGWEQPESRTAAMVDAAFELESLTDEQREELTNLAQRIEASRLTFLREYRDVIFEMEGDMLDPELRDAVEGEDSTLDLWRVRVVGWPDGHPVGEVLETRASRDKAVFDRVLNVLTPEQRDELLLEFAPKPVVLRSDGSAATF